MANTFSAATKKFGLKISIKKTEVVMQAAPGTNPPEPKIKIDGTVLNVVKSFKYLGSVITDDCKIDSDINNRIRLASDSFGRLGDRVWNDCDITLQTKLIVYQAVVLSTLLYGCEAWTCYRHHIRKLEQFHRFRLRTLLGVKWQDMIPDTELLSRSKLSSIEAYIMRHRLRWSGHVMRMNEARLPKKVFNGELKSGKRKTGRPLLRYKDVLKQSLKLCGISEEALENQGRPTDNPKELREGWRAKVTAGVKHFEASRVEKAQEKRKQRKERQAANQALLPPTARSTTTHPATAQTTAIFKCPFCLSHAPFKNTRGLNIHIGLKHKKTN
jgi:hypothetical protein